MVSMTQNPERGQVSEDTPLEGKSITVQLKGHVRKRWDPTGVVLNSAQNKEAVREIMQNGKIYLRRTGPRQGREDRFNRLGWPHPVGRGRDDRAEDKMLE